jgi:hypothetical protein
MGSSLMESASLHLFGHTFQEEVTLYAYECTSEWNAGTSQASTSALWNSYNEDYSSSTTISSTSFTDIEIDVTEIFAHWDENNTYAGYGIMLMLNGEGDTDDSTCSYQVVLRQTEHTASNTYFSIDYTTFEGTVYVNNKDTGKFLLNNGTQTALTTDTYSTASNRKWYLTYLGENTYTISPYLVTGQMLGVSNGNLTYGSVSTSPDNSYRWILTHTSTSSYGKIKNVATGHCLYVNASGNISLGNNQSSNSDWRLCKMSAYVHLTNFSVADRTINTGATIIPTIIRTPSTATWATYEDFEYTITSESESISYNPNTHKFKGLEPDTAYITVTHKITNITKTFSITANCPTVVIPCTFAKTASYPTVKSFPISISPYISSYTSTLSGATWQAYGNGAANFDLENMTVSGVSTGLAWLDAKKDNATVLRCFVYVENILQTFYPSIQDYLYIDGSMLGTMSCDRYEENPGIDPYILRTEWFLCVINLHNQGKSDEEIREALKQQFDVNFGNDKSFRDFIGEVEFGAKGGCSRENVKLSFDGLRSLFNFYWFQYAAYSIATLDTVNVYTPATAQDIAIENEYAKNLCNESRKKTKEILSDFTNRGDSSSVVIGTSYDNKSWYGVGENIGASYFYSENYDSVYATNPYEVKAANRQFINDALTQNKTFYCSHDPVITLQNYPNSSYAEELNYIQNYYSNLSKSVTYQKITINNCEVWKIVTN